MKKSGASQGRPASELISERISELGDWRGKTLGRMRELIKEAAPDVIEEWKWMGTPVWSHDGIICTGESYKNVVKLTFAKGASLKDPARLFNSSLDGNTRRAIDIREGEEVDESAFKALVRQAVALNSSGKSKPSKKAKSKVHLFKKFRCHDQGECGHNDRVHLLVSSGSSSRRRADPSGLVNINQGALMIRSITLVLAALFAAGVQAQALDGRLKKIA